MYLFPRQLVPEAAVGQVVAFFRFFWLEAKGTEGKLICTVSALTRYISSNFKMISFRLRSVSLQVLKKIKMLSCISMFRIIALRPSTLDASELAASSWHAGAAGNQQAGCQLLPSSMLAAS